MNMSDPVTTVDERFSEGGATPTPWADTRAVLESAELFWLTTVRADGRPHVTPLVAVWFENSLYFCAGADEQKIVNLQHNDHVILTTGRINWNEGLDVVVEGVATRVISPQRLTQVAEVWTHKWDGRWNYAVGADGFHHRDGERVLDGDIYVYRVSPQKVFTFSEGSFSQTRHLFS
jgi:nitroimidazol reductase NimA-like FMN-containing flavoprotein (pyridoxamine 5'-phosphate oxidase superfamily)